VSSFSCCNAALSHLIVCAASNRSVHVRRLSLPSPFGTSQSDTRLPASLVVQLQFLVWGDPLALIYFFVCDEFLAYLFRLLAFSFSLSLSFSLFLAYFIILFLPLELNDLTLNTLSTAS